MRYRSWAVCLAGFAIIIMLCRTPADTPHMPAKDAFATKSATGTPDDPRARSRFEVLRLHDPGTGKIPDNIRNKELQFAASLPKGIDEAADSAYLSSADGGTGRQALLWHSRGPDNVGGRTRTLAYDISNPQTVLAGAVSGGVWRSTDGGQSWRRTTAALQLQAITALAQDLRPSKTHIWYAGTGERKGNSASAGGAAFKGDGVLKSVDGGRSWQLLASTATGRPQRFDNLFDYVWNLATNAANPEQDEVYVATHNTIYRSENGGSEWQIALGDRSRTTAFADIAVNKSGVVYAALSSGGAVSGIWRSVTGKPDDWAEITPEGWPPAFNRIVIGIAPDADEQIYFLAETPWNGAMGHTLWRYQAGQWQDLTDNLPAFGGAVGNYESQNSYDMVVKIMPGNPDVVFLGGTNLYRSTDGFTTSNSTAWIGGYSPANNVSMMKGHHPDQHALVFNPENPRVMLSGHDGGVSVTQNALATPVAWDSLNNGYLTSQFYSVALDPATPGSDLLIGGMQDNGTWQNSSTRQPTRWQALFGGDGGFCAVAAAARKCYVSVQFGSVFRLELDELGRRVAMANVTPARASGFLFINPFVLDPNESKVMYLAAGNSVWRNHDLSKIPQSTRATEINWQSLVKTTPSTKVTALAISAESNRLYFGTSRGEIYAIENPRNEPETRLLTNHGELPQGYVNCIALDPNNVDQMLVVFSNYNVPSLFYSEDGGDSWQNVSGNLEQSPDGSGNGPSTRWAEILPDGSQTHYFVGASTGLYSTTHLSGFSTEWLQEGAGSIGNVVVDMLDARVADQTVVAATHGRGVFSARLANRSNVEFRAFSAALRTGKLQILLKWRTISEVNTREFKIERKLDSGVSWSTVGAVEGTGSASGQSYSFVDDISGPARDGVARLSYRLRHITTESNEQISEQKTAKIDLPAVQLLQFDSQLNGDSLTTIISWETSLEFGSKSFLIERNGGQAEDAWSEIANARGQGTTDETTRYQVMDVVQTLRQTHSRHLHYRLKHVTTAGDTTLLSETQVELPGLPAKFTLRQNYPNPFNPVTVIRYQLPFASEVLLELFNPAGQRVATLVNRPQDTGDHQTVWDVSQLPLASGVYFYRLRATSLEEPRMVRTAVKKLLLAK